MRDTRTTTYMSVPTSARSENLEACHAPINAHRHRQSDGTYRDHVGPTHVERLALLSARRLDLNVVPRPTIVPLRGLLGTKPLARELSARILIRKVRIGRPAERCKTRNNVPHLARPIYRPKVIQHPGEHFVDLSYVHTSYQRFPLV